MLLCVSITPFGVPVVPLLYGRTATDSSPGAELGSRLEPLELTSSLKLMSLELLVSPTTMI